MKKKILNDEVNFNKKQFNQYSMEFMEVIKKLLEKDPSQRPSWGEIENYPFWGLNENNNNNNNSNSNNPPRPVSAINKHYSLANSQLENDEISNKSLLHKHETKLSVKILYFNSLLFF